MRSRLDEPKRNERGRAARAAMPKPKGGKALQRLLTFLAQRDPELIAEAPPTDIPPAAQPKVGPARMALRSKGASRARRAPARRQNPASKALAAALTKAASKFAKAKPRAARATSQRRAGRARTAAPPPQVNASSWTDIGPMLIPNGQTYGTGRVDVIGRVSSIRGRSRQPQASPVRVGRRRHLGKQGHRRHLGATHRPDADAGDRRGHVRSHDPTRVYAGSGEGNFYATLGAGLYRSTDGGTTWKVLADQSVRRRRFLRSGRRSGRTAKMLYAATTNGFYVSTNAGRQLEPQAAGQVLGHYRAPRRRHRRTARRVRGRTLRRRRTPAHPSRRFRCRRRRRGAGRGWPSIA